MYPSITPGISGRGQAVSGRQILSAHEGGNMTYFAQDRRLELVFRQNP